jgi:hypothetical protein
MLGRMRVRGYCRPPQLVSRRRKLRPVSRPVSAHIVAHDDYGMARPLFDRLLWVQKHTDKVRYEAPADERQKQAAGLMSGHSNKQDDYQPQFRQRMAWRIGVLSASGPRALQAPEVCIADA